MPTTDLEHPRSNAHAGTRRSARSDGGGTPARGRLDERMLGLTMERSLA
jgi:hypothetical protein